MVERISLLWFGHDRAPFADAEIDYVVQQLSLLVYRAIFAQEPHLA
jgi:hypothetical protein